VCTDAGDDVLDWGEGEDGEGCGCGDADAGADADAGDTENVHSGDYVDIRRAGSTPRTPRSSATFLHVPASVVLIFGEAFTDVGVLGVDTAEAGCRVAVRGSQIMHVGLSMDFEWDLFFGGGETHFRGQSVLSLGIAAVVYLHMFCILRVHYSHQSINLRLSSLMYHCRLWVFSGTVRP
jgi:hypothetical protein